MPETEKGSSWSRMASVSRDTLAQAPRHGRRGLVAVASRWRWWLPRLLALGGALLFFYAFYAPWLVLVNTFSNGQTTTGFTTAVNGDQMLSVLPYVWNQDAALPYTVIRLAEAVLVALGLGVATLLWMRLSPLTARLARLILLLWSLLAAAASAAAISGLLLFLQRRNQHDAEDPQAFALSIHADPHLALVPLALLLAFVAWLMLRGEARAQAALPQPARPAVHPRTPWQVLAALLFTVGVALWALGFFAVPWATVNCHELHISLNHFVAGSCAGLDAGDALVYSPRLGLKALDDSARQGSALTALYALLAGYAVLALVATWRRVRTRAMLLWCGCWLLGITLLAGLAVRGVEPILAQDPALSSASIGEWVMGPGVAITFLGLLAAWAGLIFLWRATHHGAVAEVDAQEAM
ncbi:MAG TPA: hypothetical protein VFY89_09690 [Ktedonobacterales bacterium]